MVDYPDIINYSREELVEEFCKLFDRYQELRESNEVDTQKIHDLKRALDTATAAQIYLSQELEQYSNNDNNVKDNELHRTQADFIELKKKYGKQEITLAALQQDYSTLLEENSTLSQKLQEALKCKENMPVVVETKLMEEDLERIQVLEDENMDLLQKVEDFEERSVHYTLTIAECEKNIEILRDQITCLEENLQSKRMDLEEKEQILECTQEQLSKANAKIAVISAAPEINDRKGNSLFAEVDDQRQAMKQLLTAQKKSYMQMKKIYNESEHEIRRLKRENISMHTELEACSSIFCNADKTYQEKLNARIHHLLNQNEELERKLCWTQNRLKELAREKGVMWLDSMLSFCKNETDDLKQQLYSVRIQKATLEEQLRNAQQDMARWRFESLKSRCILLDREHLLAENKIDFKPVQAIEFHISEKEQNMARPRIVSKRRSSTFDSIVARRSLTSKNESKEEIVNMTETTIKEVVNSSENQSIPSELLTQVNIDENIIVAVEEPTKQIHEKAENSNIPIYDDLRVQNGIEDKENCDDAVNNLALLKAEPPSPKSQSQRSHNKMTSSPARSILATKDRALISIEPGKNVKFSSNEDIVHNYSPDMPSPSTCTTTNSNSEDINSSTDKVSGKIIVQKTCTKSNIVIRRVFVSSKHE